MTGQNITTVVGLKESFSQYRIISPVSIQRAKKVVSDRPGLADFAIRLAIFVLNLPGGQVLFSVEIQITEDCDQSC